MKKGKEKVLVLGGTQFIGRNLVEALLEDDRFEVTLCNRGITGAACFPHVKRIRVDRNTEAISEAVKGDWDYVVDLSCYFPRSLERILHALPPTLKKYIFVSTCSVYQNSEDTLKDESHPLKTCKAEEYDDPGMHTYGQRKVACEDLLRASDLNYSILRPALVYGRYDHTDRLYYWLHQARTYPTVLLPDQGQQKFSLTYVMDLVAAILHSLTPAAKRETYNLISHPQSSIRQIFETGKALLGNNPRTHEIPAESLHELQISQWTDMPLWVDGDYFTFSSKKFYSSFDLSPSSFAESIQATLDYYEALGWHKPVYGMNRARQEQLIEQFAS